MVLTEADVVTVVAITAIVVAGMVAVSVSVIVMAVEMIETESSQGNDGSSVELGTVIFLIPSPHSLNS